VSLGSRLLGLWHQFRVGPAERRTERERARFWAQVREGQREAEDRARLLEKRPGTAGTPP